MRLTHSSTGVVVNVRDDHRLGSEWGPADASAGLQGQDEPEPDEDDDEPETTCDECGFEAKSASGLASHSRTHDS